MRELIRSEVRKIGSGASLWVLGAIMIGLGALTTQGFTEAAHRALSAGLTDEVTQTAVIARSWFSATLLAAIAGAMVVTREFSAGTIARTALVGVRRDRVVLAKLVTAGGIGLVFGLIAAGLAVAAPFVTLPTAGGYRAVWSHEATVTVLGIVAAAVASALWGLAIGWIIRNQVVAILVIVLLTLMVEPGLRAFAPGVAAYAFTILLTAVTLDPHDDLLGLPAAYAALLVWLVVLSALARWMFTRRDVA